MTKERLEGKFVTEFYTCLFKDISFMFSVAGCISAFGIDTTNLIPAVNASNVWPSELTYLCKQYVVHMSAKQVQAG